MSSPGSTVHNIPFITKGIGYRNDFIETGSLVPRPQTGAAKHEVFTDGDILTMRATGSVGSFTGILNMVIINLSGSPIRNFTKYAMRAKTGSNIFNFAGASGIAISFWSGSLNSNDFFTGSTFQTMTGSILSTLNNYIDKIEMGIQDISGSFTGSGFVDFVMLYNENLELRYINNPSTYSLKKRIIELSPPMREQGILQHLGAQSPRINLDGVIVSDSNFTAQQYRDKLVDVWQEGNWQWLNTDMINYKFQPEDLSITQLPGITNYYRFEFGLKQYTTISASSGSYNLA